MKRFLTQTALGMLSALVVVTPTRAQEATIGTDLEAETTLQQSGDDTSWVSQTFVAAGGHLMKLSIWFYGGTRSERGAPFYNRVHIASGAPPAGSFSEGFYTEYLDHTVQGRYDFAFDEYLPMVMGDTYTFTVFGDYCADFYDSPCDPPVTDGGSDPMVEVTTTDAYLDGDFYRHWADDGPEPASDIRFEATFVTVPEPSSWVLLLSGLLGLGIIAQRRGSAA